MDSAEKLRAIEEAMGDLMKAAAFDLRGLFTDYLNKAIKLHDEIRQLAKGSSGA